MVDSRVRVWRQGQGRQLVDRCSWERISFELEGSKTEGGG